MSEYKYKKGMKPAGEVPGRQRKAFDAAFSYLPKPEAGKPVILRPVGGVCTLGVHKLRFTKTDGSPSGFKTLCPDWDIENQAPREGKRVCPICRDFGAYGLPKEIKIALVFDYIFHAFHVTNIKKGAEPQFGLVGNVNMMNWPELLEVTQMNSGVDLFDPKHGCCVNWVARPSKFAPGQQEMHFTQGQPLPTAWKDDMWVTKIDGTLYRGEEQDLLALIAEPDPEEMAESLDRLGFYTRLEKITGVRKGAKFTPPQDLADESDDFETSTPAPAGKMAAPDSSLEDPDLDDADEDLDPVPTPAPKAKAKTKAPAPPAEDDFEEDPAPAPAPKAKGKAAKAAPPPAEDEFEDDPVPTPAPKAKGKAAKAPAPPAEDDFEDEDAAEDAPEPSKAKPIPAKKTAPAAPPADEDEWED